MMRNCRSDPVSGEVRETRVVRESFDQTLGRQIRKGVLSRSDQPSYRRDSAVVDVLFALVGTHSAHGSGEVFPRLEDTTVESTHSDYVGYDRIPTAKKCRS